MLQETRAFFLKQMTSLASHLGLVYEALNLIGPEIENTVSEEGERIDRC